MNIIAIETASGRCSVAILRNTELLAAELLVKTSQQAEELLAMVERVLTKANLALQDMDYIAVSNGPGSFTGIRIGLAACLGLSAATKLPSVVVSNFALINYRIREQARNFEVSMAIIDAYRDEFYVQIFDKINKKNEPRVLVADEIYAILRANAGKIACAGSGIYKLNRNITHLCHLLPRFPHPDAKIVAKLARQQILQNNYSSQIEPLYIRAPDAKLPLTIT